MVKTFEERLNIVGKATTGITIANFITVIQNSRRLKQIYRIKIFDLLN